MPGITESFLSTLSEEERDKFCLNILKINAPEFFGNMNLEEYKHIREKTTEEETEQKCCRCKIIKTYSDFKIIKRRGLFVPNSYCKECQTIYNKNYNKNKSKTSCRNDTPSTYI